MSTRIADYQLFAWGDSRFYEEPSSWRLDRPVLSAADLPEEVDGWRCTRRGPWIGLEPAGSPLPAQGWKLHLSASPGSFGAVVEATVAVCGPRRVPFKVLHDGRMHLIHNSKYAPRGLSGKAATIYPADPEQLLALADDLEARLAGATGPDVLGDLRISTAPIFIRYGAFRDRWFVDRDGEIYRAVDDGSGRPVPDRRLPAFRLPEGITLPTRLAGRVRRAGTLDGAAYVIDGALHFSNAGGVYSATATDGRRLVVKESRPFAGIDLEGVDAVGRSRTEEAALRALEGVPGVPVLHSVVEVDGHRYLAMERVDGDMLWQWQGKHNPLIWPSCDAADRRAYARRVAALHADVSAVLEAVHGRGVIHRDLHPANIVVTPEGTVCLLDFEVADLGPGPSRPRRPMGALGFVPRERLDGPAADRFAMAALRLWLHVPAGHSWAHQPDKARLLARDAEELFDLPSGRLDDCVKEITARPGTVSVVERPADPADQWPGDHDDWRDTLDRIWEAVDEAATPGDPDRLYPGDVRLFSHASESLAFGAAGVLWARAASGRAVPDKHIDWLDASLARDRPRRPGLMTGLAGLVPLQLLLGRRDEAVATVDRALAATRDVDAIDLWSGLAGIGLATLRTLETAGAPAPSRVAALAERVAAALASGATLPGAGLFHGPSGPGLFLGEAGRVLGRPDLAAAAARAVASDVAATRRTPTGTRQAVEAGRRTLAYLEPGSAGMVVALAALPTALADNREASSELLRACCSEFTVEPGLLMGRAGLLLALTAALRAGAANDEVRAAASRHRRRTAWHALAAPDGRGIEFPGPQGFRVTTDLGTGAAGIAHALTASLDPGVPLLPFLPGLRYPGPERVARRGPGRR